MLSIIVIEAGVLALGSTVAGALAGAALGGILNAFPIEVSEGFQLFLMRDTRELVVEPRSLVVAISVITAVVTLFSLLPARKAARVPPITAIHHVG